MVNTMLRRDGKNSIESLYLDADLGCSTVDNHDEGVDFGNIKERNGRNYDGGNSAYKVFDEMSSIKFIKQDGSVREYYDTFVSFANRVGWNDLCAKGMKENEIVIDKQENEVKQDSSVSNVRVAANDFDDSVATDSDIRKQNVDFRKDIKGDEVIEFVVDDKDGGYSVEDICEQNVEGADMELDDNNCLVVIDKVCNKAGKVLTWSQMKSVKCSTCCKRKDRGWNKIVKTQCKVKCRRKSEMWKWPNRKKRRRKESWVKLVFCWNKDLYIRFVQWLDYLRQVTDVESRMAAYGPKRLGIRKKMLCNMLEGSNNVGKAKNVASNDRIHIEHKLYQMMLKDCDFERDCRSSFVEAPKA
ncbi:hypothetical protein Tco_0138878 [Tanacetum coccineum]